MSGNTSYSPFAKKIMEKDRELRKRMEDAHGESERILKILQERLAYYSAAGSVPTDPVTRVLVDSMEGDAVNQLALFQIRKDFDEQTSQIITRLDNMENEIRTIRDKLSINQK